MINCFDVWLLITVSYSRRAVFMASTLEFVLAFIKFFSFQYSYTITLPY